MSSIERDFELTDNPLCLGPRIESKKTHKSNRSRKSTITNPKKQFLQCDEFGKSTERHPCVYLARESAINLKIFIPLECTGHSQQIYICFCWSI